MSADNNVIRGKSEAEQQRRAVIREIRGRGIPIRENDIDTDRIIPARYLKTVTFDELGEFAFYDARFDAGGKPTDHPMNDPRYRGASVLLVRKNFGCGSSREHAPQALMRWGIRVIIGESFAEIFAGNCTAVGVPVVSAGEDVVESLMQLVEHEPDSEIRVDLDGRLIKAGALTYPLEISESQAQVFRTGTWDTTAVLISALDEVRETAMRIPYIAEFPY